MNSAHILIIDDEEIIIRALSRAFQREGFQVSSASDGEMGLKKIISEKPSLIILDIIMPKISGLEVLEHIRTQEHMTTPVILMTAYGDAKTESTAKELGVSAYLTKPFNNIEDIIALVHRLTS